MNKDILYEIQTISSEVQISQVPIPGSLAYRQHEKWPIDSDLPVKKSMWISKTEGTWIFSMKLHMPCVASCFFKAAQAPGSGDDRPILRDHGNLPRTRSVDLEAAGAARSW